MGKRKTRLPYKNVGIRNSAAHYNAYSLLPVEDVYNFSYGATANNQEIINPKERKMPLWDPDPSPSLPSRTYAFTSVATW